MCALWSRSKDDAASRDREFLREVLTRALEQRAKFRLTLLSQVTSLREVSGSLADFGDFSGFGGFGGGGLDMEISSLKGGSQSWVGSPVSCYFRVRDLSPEAVSRFYTFDTRIEAVRTAQNGLTHFTLAMPQRATHAQQRRSVRVPAGPGRVPVFMVWKDLREGADVSGTPPLLQLDDQTRDRMRLENISACGLRLTIQNALLTELGLKPAPGDSFAFYFKALDGQDIPEKTFLVSATLRNVFSDPQAGETSLGLEFQAEGRRDRNKRLVWTPLKNNEATGLPAFILKWNLADFHRDKRADEE